MSTAHKSPVSMPDAFVILFFVMLLAAIASYVIPAGSFNLLPAEANAAGELQKPRIDPKSFSYSENTDQGVKLFAEQGETGFLNYAFEGMVSGDKMGAAVGVIAFILLTGGAFGIIMQSGAVNNGILALIKRTQHMQFLFIPLMFFMFSLGGAVFGMGEEAIAFCIVLLPLMLALGYDAITTVLVTYIATQIGFATSWMNPFSVAIAQGIADVPLMSGSGYRMVLWVVFTLFGIIFTLKYANKIKENPELSVSFTSDQKLRGQQQAQQQGTFALVDAVILSLFVAGIGWVIWGVVARGYYIPEIATQFFALGLATAIVAIIGKRMTMNGAADAFKQGAAELLPAALIVGMAKGIVLLLGGDDPTQPSVLNTLLFVAGNSFEGVPAYFSAWFMLIFQSIFNFFVTSGSGQAALTMPLVAPLSDLVGVSRQIAVLAFQLGDGLTNCIIPTSASLIGCLGVVRVDWMLWAKFAWKLQLWLFALASSAVLLAVAIGYQ
ncbi:MAG: putative basic amino acid antiporter YfcC [Gammaproteobacteria bacterium]|nr:putative basic amino acid antiporter YfcC [Gammaproteobacteria bacterium]